MYLVLSAFTSKPVSLLTTAKASVSFFTACTLLPSILKSSAQTRRWCVLFNFKPSWFTGTLQMAYSSAKLKSNRDKASPCFKTFFVGNITVKCLPTRTTKLLYLLNLLKYFTYLLTYLLTYLHTYLLHTAQSFLRS